MMRCFGDRKKVRKMLFFAAILRPFGGVRQKFTGERATGADVSVKFRSIGSGLTELFQKK